ncbi:hypothetical protein AC230_01655 [Streptomyces caatingaensis]|uniref:Uncharacterized protein n=1 Tax=Streptomyces caatingaensis TaxID=1678637 RepID=A0A0K9XJ36_9ACTN|nr:hypothetical protein AC230_01655 [Streptomyces caatingaensis]
MGVAGVAVGLHRQPGGDADGVRVLGLLRGDHPAVRDPPQQGGAGLVGREELGQGVDLGQEPLQSPPVRRRPGPPHGESGVPDEAGQQPAEDVAVARGRMPGGPRPVEATPQLLRRRRLAVPRDRIGV